MSRRASLKSELVLSSVVVVTTVLVAMGAYDCVASCDAVPHGDRRASVTNPPIEHARSTR